MKFDKKLVFINYLLSVYQENFTKLKKKIFRKNQLSIFPRVTVLTGISQYASKTRFRVLYSDVHLQLNRECRRLKSARNPRKTRLQCVAGGWWMGKMRLLAWRGKWHGAGSWKHVFSLFMDFFDFCEFCEFGSFKNSNFRNSGIFFQKDIFFEDFDWSNGFFDFREFFRFSET